MKKWLMAGLFVSSIAVAAEGRISPLDMEKLNSRSLAVTLQKERLDAAQRELNAFLTDVRERYKIDPKRDQVRDDGTIDRGPPDPAPAKEAKKKK